MPLACDNCIPGDASAWDLPLSLGALVALLLAVWCVWLSARREGVSAVLTRVAAAFVVGPVGALLMLGFPASYRDVTCGSALSASLSRPLPGHDLDANQEGCRRSGADRVAFAGAWAGTAAGGAAVCLTAAALPQRRRTAYA